MIIQSLMRILSMKSRKSFGKVVTVVAKPIIKRVRIVAVMVARAATEAVSRDLGERTLCRIALSLNLVELSRIGFHYSRDNHPSSRRTALLDGDYLKPT